MNKLDTPIKKKCKFCGNEFETQYEIQLYCSDLCKRKQWIKTGKKPPSPEYKKICLYCDMEFTTNHKHQIYCTKKCQSKARYQKAKEKIYELQCKNCNAIITSQTKTDYEFCCVECEEEYKMKNTLFILDSDLNDNIQSGNTDYAKQILWEIVNLKVTEIINKENDNTPISLNRILDYRDLSDIPQYIKEYVLQRDNHQCQICHNENNLHIHHITKRANGGDHNAEYLISLCSSCHRHVESGNIELATKGCYKNALKFYTLDHQENHLTFSKIYDDLIILYKQIKDQTYDEATYNLNILIDRLEDELKYY